MLFDLAATKFAILKSYEEYESRVPIEQRSPTGPHERREQASWHQKIIAHLEAGSKVKGSLSIEQWKRKKKSPFGRGTIIIQPD